MLNEHPGRKCFLCVQRFKEAQQICFLCEVASVQVASEWRCKEQTPSLLSRIRGIAFRRVVGPPADPSVIVYVGEWSTIESGSIMDRLVIHRKNVVVVSNA